MYDSVNAEPVHHAHGADAGGADNVDQGPPPGAWRTLSHICDESVPVLFFSSTGPVKLQ